METEFAKLLCVHAQSHTVVLNDDIDAPRDWDDPSKFNLYVCCEDCKTMFPSHTADHRTLKEFVYKVNSLITEALVEGAQINVLRLVKIEEMLESDNPKITEDIHQLLHMLHDATFDMVGKLGSTAAGMSLIMAEADMTVLFESAMSTWTPKYESLFPNREQYAAWELTHKVLGLFSNIEGNDEHLMLSLSRMHSELGLVQPPEMWWTYSSVYNVIHHLKKTDPHGIGGE